MTINRLIQILFVSGILALASCSASNTKSTLYDELGGQTGIDALIEQLLWAITEDDRIVGRFIDADISRFQERLGEQICYLSGGPCQYSGESMARVHGGQGIREAEFNALVESLLTAMESLEIPIPTQNRLLAKLAPMQTQIVGK